MNSKHCRIRACVILAAGLVSGFTAFPQVTRSQSAMKALVGGTLVDDYITGR